LGIENRLNMNRKQDETDRSPTVGAPRKYVCYSVSSIKLYITRIRILGINILNWQDSILKLTYVMQLIIIAAAQAT